MRVKLKLPGRKHFRLGLRWRLTVTYAFVFTALLSFLGVFFRQTLKSIYDAQVRESLDLDWGVLRAYLRIDQGKADWFYDRQNPEEAKVVGRIQEVYLLTDNKSNLMEISEKYSELGADWLSEIQAVVNSKTPLWRVRSDDRGEPFLIRSGRLQDESTDQYYYVAIGRSLAGNKSIIEQFTWNYFIAVPLMIAACTLLGWFISGRALSPVNELARTAQEITGSNLNSQIPSRGSNDEIDKLIEAFNHMIERLDNSFRQTRQFSADVSHELRTPLTSVRGQLEVALFAAKTVEQYQEAIGIALEDVERLSQTIRALLLLSQAESGQLSLQNDIVDVSAVAQDVIEQYEIFAESGEVRLTSALAPVAFVKGDRLQLERMVSNLLSNAIKYTPRNGSVHLRVGPRGDELEIVIEDTGIGIPQDHLPHIFDRFYRVPSTERKPTESVYERGLGLGLSFVAWIVKAHGGEITVDSTPGLGSRFVVRLASVPPPEKPAEVAAAAEPAPVAAENG